MDKFRLIDLIKRSKIIQYMPLNQEVPAESNSQNNLGIGKIILHGHRSFPGRPVIWRGWADMLKHQKPFDSYAFEEERQKGFTDEQRQEGNRLNDLMIKIHLSR